MKQKTYRLTETQLHNVVTKAVSRIIREGLEEQEPWYIERGSYDDIECVQIAKEASEATDENTYINLKNRSMISLYETYFDELNEEFKNGPKVGMKSYYKIFWGKHNSQPEFDIEVHTIRYPSERYPQKKEYTDVVEYGINQKGDPTITFDASDDRVMRLNINDDDGPLNPSLVTTNGVNTLASDGAEVARAILWYLVKGYNRLRSIK